MTKTCKKILTSVFLALCFVVSALAITACDKTPKTVTYTITVQDENGPRKGIGVQIGQGGNIYDDLERTDSNGIARFELPPDDYEVTLSFLPDKYSVPETASLTLTKDKHDLTVTLERDFALTVKLVQPNGEPYYHEGVEVVICRLDTGSCLAAEPIDEFGVAVKENPPKTSYHAKVDGLPDNVTYVKDDQGYFIGESEDVTATLTPTERVITITIYPVMKLDLTKTAMTSNEKTEFAKKSLNASYTVNLQTLEARAYSCSIPAGSTQYFALTPTMSGVYHILTTNSVSYSTMSAGGYFGIGYFVYEAGVTYVFTAQNNGVSEATAEFVVISPRSSYVSYTGNVDANGKSFPLVVGSANTNAIFAFTPTQAGKYTFEASALSNVSIGFDSEHYYNEPDEFCAASESETLKDSVEFTVYPEAVGITHFFTVSVNAATGDFPVDVSTVIKKTGNVNDETKNVSVTETLVKPETPTSKELHGIPMGNGTQALLQYDDTAKAYRYKPNGNADDGYIVYVKLTKSIDKTRFAEGVSLAYIDKSGKIAVTYAFTENNPSGDGRITTDYRWFLRGFKDYKYEATMTGTTATIPSVLEQSNCYANYVNEDGVYPLTQELYDFLKLFYAKNAAGAADEFFGSAIPFLNCIPSAYRTSDSAWLFPCYYYGEIEETDAIVGEYEFVSKTESGTTTSVGDTKEEWQGGGQVTKEDYKLVIEDGTFAIYELLSGEYDSNPILAGTWSKNGETYTFTDDSWMSIVYTVTFNSETGSITITQDADNCWVFNRVS